MRLILVRHGETDVHLSGLMQGNNGAPLNATGRAQASAVAQALKSELPFAMYTSPVRRALETAGIVSELLDVPAATLPELRELEVGELDGLTGDEMRERYPEYMKDWSKDPATARPPGGETVQRSRRWPGTRSTGCLTGTQTIRWSR